MSFISDLKDGEEAEKIVAKALQDAYGIRLEKNANKKGVDLVSPIMSVEVKLDRKALETGNVFIELTSSKTPSGLFAHGTESPHLFCILVGEELGVFGTRKLKDKVFEWAGDGTYRLVNGGDGWRSRGILVPWEELKEEAIEVLHL